MRRPPVAHAKPRLPGGRCERSRGQLPASARRRRQAVRAAGAASRISRKKAGWRARRGGCCTGTASTLSRAKIAVGETATALLLHGESTHAQLRVCAARVRWRAGKDSWAWPRAPRGNRVACWQKGAVPASVTFVKRTAGWLRCRQCSCVQSAPAVALRERQGQLTGHLVPQHVGRDRTGASSWRVPRARSQLARYARERVATRACFTCSTPESRDR